MAIETGVEVAYDKTLPEAIICPSKEVASGETNVHGYFARSSKPLALSRKAFWTLLIAVVLILGGGILGVGLGEGLRSSKDSEATPRRYQLFEIDTKCQLLSADISIFAIQRPFCANTYTSLY